MSPSRLACRGERLAALRTALPGWIIRHPDEFPAAGVPAAFPDRAGFFGLLGTLLASAHSDSFLFSPYRLAGPIYLSRIFGAIFAKVRTHLLPILDKESLPTLTRKV